MEAGPVEGPACSLTRYNIMGLQILEEHDGIVSKSFYPLDKLRQCLTRERVTQVLQCSCKKCRTESAIFGNNISPLQYLTRITGVPDQPYSRTKTAFALFALLIYIEHPMLVIGFLERQCTDFHLQTSPDSFSIDNLRNTYCFRYASWAARQKSDRFNQFAKQFARFFSEFAVPRMDSGVFTCYNANIILPFVNERKIGLKNEHGETVPEGANGRVYAFEIYEEYRHFRHAKGVMRFARKELHGNTDFAAYLEKANLEHAQTFEDDHIVKLIKAYKHGGIVNLIFPFAKTNLDHLLRDPQFEYAETIGSPIESHKAWRQLLGVARALGKIAGIPDESSPIAVPSCDQYHGFHFDLKPANILIDDKNNWVITDFGQATFIPVIGGTSRVANQGGTDAYAPPEIDNMDEKFSRRYDVWSLGCIILEVTAFLILGYSGLSGCSEFKGLDQVRRSRPEWSRIEDDRFFCQEIRQGEYKVKKEINDFMDFLKALDRSKDQRSRDFLEKILVLIKKMLEPKVEERIEIGDVIRRLDAAIKQASPVGLTGERLEMVTRPGERSIGGPDLSSVRLWHYGQESSLQVFEDSNGNLRLYCVANNAYPSQDHLKRGRVRLIPLYLFRQSDHDRSHASAPWICFSDTSPTGVQEYPGSIFSFSETEDALMVQSIFTSQKIEQSLQLVNVKLKRYVSLGDRLRRGIASIWRSNRAQAEQTMDTEDLGPARVQLWTELAGRKPSAVSLSTAESSGPRPPRQQPHQQPGYQEARPRRLVLYLEKSHTIITVPMDRNWREKAHESHMLKFVPTDPDRDPHFVACALRPSDSGEPFAGVPLCTRELQNLEYLGRFETDQLELTFMTETTRDEFQAKYLDLKKAWRTERKELETRQWYTPVHRDLPPNQDSELASVIGKNKGKAQSFAIPLGAGRGDGGRKPGASQQIRPDPHKGGGRGGTKPPKKTSDKISKSSLYEDT